MSLDRLQERIRKLKNPSVVDFSISPEHIPPHLHTCAGSFVEAYKIFCTELLEGLRETVPAVRFNFNFFALLGAEGLLLLENVLHKAREQGYYILLDGVQMLSALDAQQVAQIFCAQECKWCFDGMIVSAYIGSDGIRPLAEGLKKTDKDLFVVVRTSNRTAPELQDLLTGGRLVHLAKADIVNRFADTLPYRCGYAQVGIMAAAASADSLRTLRAKYKTLFMLLDGSDYPNANAKNCSFAFDRLGHGAAACAGLSITAAWQGEGTEGTDYVQQAVSAAERMKKKINRYVTIL